MTGKQGGASPANGARLREVIHRAIQLDRYAATPEHFAAVREIATSLGISEENLDRLLDQALEAEVTRKRNTKRIRRIRGILSFATAVVFGLITKFLGILLGAEAGPIVVLAGAGPLAVLSLTLVLYNRWRGDQRTFQLENAAIWAGFTLATLTLTSGMAENLMPGAVAWLVLAVVGAAVIGSRRSEPTLLARERIVERVLRTIAAETGQKVPTPEVKAIEHEGRAATAQDAGEVTPP